MTIPQVNVHTHPEGRSGTKIIPLLEEGRGMSTAPAAPVVLSLPRNPL